MKSLSQSIKQFITETAVELKLEIGCMNLSSPVGCCLFPALLKVYIDHNEQRKVYFN